MMTRIKGRLSRNVVIVCCAVGAGLALWGVATGAAQLARTAETPYQERLRLQVEASGARPRAARDPALRRQITLEAAARAKNGPGTRVRALGRDLRPRKIQRKPGTVLPDTRRSRVVSGGCLLDYGDPGAQCVPAKAPGNAPLACGYVVKLFPTGVKVTGRDVLGLDTNRDRLACGRGDRGVAAPATAHAGHGASSG